MNNKIPLSKIAELTAKDAGVGQNESLQFVKDLFAVIEEDVSLGNEVTVPGLGKFSKSAVPGEPIAFEPDEDFAAEINEDFALFEPTEINDEVSDEALDAVSDTDIEETATERTEEVAEVSEIKAPETIEETSPAVDEEPPALPETEIESEPVQPVELQPEPVFAESVSVEEKVANPVCESAPEACASAPVHTEKLEESSKPEPPAESPAVTETVIETAAESEPEEAVAIPEDEEEYVIVRHRKSRFWVGFILGLLIGFAIGVIAFLAYLVNYLNIPVENIVVM